MSFFSLLLDPINVIGSGVFIGDLFCLKRILTRGLSRTVRYLVSCRNRNQNVKSSQRLIFLTRSYLTRDRSDLVDVKRTIQI